MHDLPDAGWDVPGWMLARVLDNYTVWCQKCQDRLSLSSVASLES